MRVPFTRHHSPEEEDQGDGLFYDMLPVLLFAVILLVVIFVGFVSLLIYFFSAQTLLSCATPFVLFFIFDYFWKENQKISQEKG